MSENPDSNASRGRTPRRDPPEEAVNPFRSPQVNQPQTEHPSKNWGEIVSAVAGLGLLTIFVLGTVIRVGFRLAGSFSAPFGDGLSFLFVILILGMALFLLGFAWRLAWTKNS